MGITLFCTCESPVVSSTLFALVIDDLFGSSGLTITLVILNIKTLKLPHPFYLLDNVLNLICVH